MKTDCRIIVALDFDCIEKVRAFVKQISPQLCRLKIGNILFTHYGPAIVEELMNQGFDVFLDLKYHDIPATVAGAVRAAGQLGVWMVNLHISGGVAMMQAAREAADQFQHKPLLIGVTILTSLEQSDLKVMGMIDTIANTVKEMANKAKQNDLDGVVCSSLEVEQLRQTLGEQFLLVTPGIRLASDAADDQKRIMTPAAAIKAGASYLVIGRSITKAVDPLATLEKISKTI